MFNVENQETFASRLKNIRYCCALTQDTLSLAAGIDRSTLAYYESGRVFPSMSKLCLLSALFDVTVDELLGHSDESQLILRDDDGTSLNEGDDGTDIRDGIPTSLAELKTEEQLLVLYFRQLLEKDRNEFLNNISELAEEMQRMLIDPNDEDIILVDDLDDFIESEI